MLEAHRYSTQLQAGLGLVEETESLLGLWLPGMSVPELYQLALQSGRFPRITARRLRNVVAECFAPRYLVDDGAPAKCLKTLEPRIGTPAFRQLMFLFTSRANPILADFVRQVYWQQYAAGQATASNEDAQRFIRRSLDDGKMVKRWSESTVKRVSGYLVGCCADYGLLDDRRGSSGRILPFRILTATTAYLAYDLHLRLGLGDNALLEHQDWQLFGLSRQDVLEELKVVALKGILIVQAAGHAVKLGWKYDNMEALYDVLADS